MTDKFTLKMNEGVTALVSREYDRAAEAFHKARRLRPDDPQPALLEGQALVYGRRPQHAIVPLQNALALDADSAQAHELLASAYAAASMRKERDAQIALLRQWHSDAKHTSVASQSGFLLETFPVRGRHINAYLYFAPHDKAQTVYRFSVRTNDEQLVRMYCADTSDQEYRLESCSDPPHDDGYTKPLKTYAAMPDYDTLKSDVIAAVRGNEVSGAGR